MGGPPLFASEVNTSCGPSIGQGMGHVLALSVKRLGDQWSIGDWAGMQAAARTELPRWVGARLAGMAIKPTKADDAPTHAPSGPPQNMKEYDPEWARAFRTGTATAGCDHARMLAAVRVPVLFTHHFRLVDEETGGVMGACSDQQARRVRTLVADAGQPLDHRSFPAMAHSMHGQDPELFTQTILDWSTTLT